MTEHWLAVVGYEGRERNRRGEPLAALAREFHVNPSTMWNAVNGRTWTA